MVVFVIDGVAVSAPVMVTVYVPFATVGVVLEGGDDVELPPPQPAASPITTKMPTAATIASLCGRRLTSQATSSPPITKPICAPA